MKKNHFLRIFSIAFVICMAVALLPTVFASDTEYAMSGITVQYSFDKQDYQSLTTGKEISYLNTSGRVQYDSFYGTKPVVDNFGWFRNAMSLYILEGQYYAFRIRIPNAGWYAVSVGYNTHSSATQGEMYILPSTTTDIAATLKKEDPVLTVNFNGVDSLQTAAIPFTTDTKLFKAEAAGEYYLVWTGTGTTNAQNRHYLLPRLVTLNGGDEAPVVMYAESELSKNTIDSIIGETATISTTTAKMSDGTDATATDIEKLTYVSSDVNIATVSGNTVTAVSKGNVKIYTMSGDLKVAENEITVEMSEIVKSGITVKYSFDKQDYQSLTTGKEISYLNTGERIEYDSFYGTKPVVDNFSWFRNAMSLYILEGQYYAFRIQIPKAGWYDVSVGYNTHSSATQGEMYILPSTTTDIAATLKKEDPVLTVNFNGVDSPQTAAIPFTTDTKLFEAEAAGEYYLVWTGTGTTNAQNRHYVLPRLVTLNGGDSAALMGTKISSDKRVIALAGEETAQVTAIGYLSTTGEAVGFTYSSENPSVATVSADGTVTAKNGGVAKITATCTNAVSGNNSLSTMIVVDEPSNTVSFGADSNVNGVSITTNISGYTQGEVTSVSLETPVTVTAKKTVDDYVFRGWVRGSEKGGRFISNEYEYSFNAMKNTYLTAIYTLAADKEYYAWNGEFLGTEEPEEPEVLGYVFDEWKPSEDADVTRYVAQYTQAADEYNVTYNGVTNKYKFNDKVVLESNTAVYWYRNDKLVDYGTEYTFYVWDDATVKTSSEGHELPIVVLDAKVKDNNFMIEYDNAGKEIVEVGILFGNAGSVPTVSSCYENMNSQRENVSHGQFTARADQYTNARGYLIYRDNDDSFKVIYSE